MHKASFRRLVGIIILLISLALLIWGLWPQAHVVQTLPLPPAEMSLPTPHSCLPVLQGFFLI